MCLAAHATHAAPPHMQPRNSPYKHCGPRHLFQGCQHLYVAHAALGVRLPQPRGDAGKSATAEALSSCVVRDWSPPAAPGRVTQRGVEVAIAAIPRHVHGMQAESSANSLVVPTRQVPRGAVRGARRRMRRQLLLVAVKKPKSGYQIPDTR